MTVFGRRRKSTGLDIGSGFIKLVQVDHSGDQPEVTRVGICPLPATAVVGGTVTEPFLVATKVRELVDASGVEPLGLVVSMGSRDVVLRTITMERMAEEDARQVLALEVDRHIPIDPREVVVDLHILDPHGTGPEMDVLLAAASRKLVRERLALLADAGLDPWVVDVDALALHNAFRHNHPEVGPGVTALVDLGHDSTTVNMMMEGRPVLSETVPFGTRQIREELEYELGFREEEVEAAILGRVRPVELQPLVDIGAEDVAAAIRQSSSLVLPMDSGRDLGQVFLSGEGARISGMADGLANRLGVETRWANPFERTPVRPGAVDPLDLEEVASMLQLPLGLGLRCP